MSILRRLFRRGPDEEAIEAVISMLARRSMSGRAAVNPEAVAAELSLPRGTRALAVIELDADAAPLRHVIASRIGGQAAGHMGRMTVTGIHVTLDRRSLSEQWPLRWATPMQAQPSAPAGALGETQDFVWRPTDATGAGVAEVVELLSASERVTRWVNVVLQEPSTIQVEVAPSASRIRVAAHRTGEGLPYATTVEAVLTVARAIAEP